MNTPRFRFFGLGAALFFCVCAVPSSFAKVSSPVPPAIAAAVQNPERFAGDSEDDAWRKPLAVLTFMGVKPAMHVLDYFAGAGYYSELLSRSVGPSGSVIVYNNPEYAQFAGDKLARRFANNRLANTKVVTVSTSKLQLDPGSLDGVLFVMSYHDLYWQPKDARAPFGKPTQVVTDLFRALKPGGVVVVLDHVANAGGDTAKVVDALHRIDPRTVKSDFTKAGFVFDSESTVLRHESDDHSKPVFDAAVRHKTDQFVYKFRKPIH